MIRHRVQISNRQRLIRFPALLIRAVINLVLEDEGVRENCEVSVLLCRDPVITRLNREYRGIDHPTDVLAFPQGEKIKPPEFEHQKYLMLGDIVISTDTALHNAEDYGASPGEEIARLLIHGTLHLLGWRDDEPGARKRMQRKESFLLTRGGLKFK